MKKFNIGYYAIINNVEAKSRDDALQKAKLLLANINVDDIAINEVDDIPEENTDDEAWREPPF